MSESGRPESRKRRKPDWFSYLVWPAPLIPGVLVFGALLLTRLVTGRMYCYRWPYLAWQSREKLAILVALLVLATAVWSVVASAYPRRMAWALARLRGKHRPVSRVSRASVLEAVEDACKFEAAVLKAKVDRLALLVRLIVLLATLGFVLSTIDSYAIITGGGCNPFTMNEGLVLALVPLAAALAFVIPLVVFHALLKSRHRALIAEARAIAKVMLDHAIERRRENGTG